MKSSFCFFLAAGIACLFIAGCGGGSDGGGASLQLPIAAATTTGDGAAPAEIPIVAAPCASCAAAGTDLPPTLPNSKLNCAP
jgi:hypothetical protein